jgi:hypothetical protein
MSAHAQIWQTSLGGPTAMGDITVPTPALPRALTTTACRATGDIAARQRHS